MVSGFLRTASVAPEVKVADVEFNLRQTLDWLERLDAQGVEVAVFPELGLTAYTCADLFQSSTLINAAWEALQRLVKWSEGRSIAFAVGLPVRTATALLNCAAFVENGAYSLVAKRNLPNYGEFYEARWFTPGAAGQQATFHTHGVTLGIEICEDLWVPAPPSSQLALQGAEVILNLSASNDVIGKYGYLTNLIKSQSGRCVCAYVYAGAGCGESSTDLVFDAKAIIAETGHTLAASERWQPEAVAIADIDIEAIRHDRIHHNTFTASTPLPVPAGYDGIDCANHQSDLAFRNIAPHPFVPQSDHDMRERCREIVNIQSAGLATRLKAIGCSTAVVGISGGLDSTLALLVTAHAFKRLSLPLTGIIGITMPGFGTTGRTHSNAVELMRLLGVTSREISISPAVKQHFADIGHDEMAHDTTYENSQARERTQILMDVANKEGGIVIGTGDLSELALGWATYNGDHMSMYGVNTGVPKTLVRYLVKWFADDVYATEPDTHRVLLDIINTPISPELTPADDDGCIAQRTEDIVGPYELHDFFLYYTLRYGFSPSRIMLMAVKAFDPLGYDTATIQQWLRVFVKRFFAQQFKRSCLPDGPKVGSVCLSPRGDWRMPSDASSALWSHSL